MAWPSRGAVSLRLASLSPCSRPRSGGSPSAGRQPCPLRPRDCTSFPRQQPWWISSPARPDAPFRPRGYAQPGPASPGARGLPTLAFGAPPFASLAGTVTMARRDPAHPDRAGRHERSTQRGRDRVTVGYEDRKAEGPDPAAPDGGSAGGGGPHAAPRRHARPPGQPDPVQRRGGGGAGHPGAERVAALARPPGPHHRRLPPPVPGTQAAGDQLAPDAGADRAGHVDLGGHARHQAPPAARHASSTSSAGPSSSPSSIAITGITAASFYLNGVFAFAISETDGAAQDPAGLHPGQQTPPHHRRLGGGIGLALSFSTLISSRSGPPVVRPGPGDRGRRHDAVLPGGAGPHGGREQDQRPARRAGHHAPSAVPSAPWCARRPT